MEMFSERRIPLIYMNVGNTWMYASAQKELLYISIKFGNMTYQILITTILSNLLVQVLRYVAPNCFQGGGNWI